MMTMIRNRDTVAATPLNNSSLPVLSKNISMGALLRSLHRYSIPLHTSSDPFPLRYSSSVHVASRAFDPPLLPGKLGKLVRFHEGSFQKASKLALKAKGERERDEKKEKWARRIRRRGTKVERGEGNRCVVERDIFFFFFPFRPAFVSPESTRQVARPPLLPVSLATSDEKRQRFLLVLRSTCSSSPPSQIKR